MIYLQYAASILLVSVALWIILLNWLVFIQVHIQGREAPSWIPLLGGILLALGFVLWPSNPCIWLCWLAFIFDWGSLPGIGHALVFHVANNKSDK